jgi:predicted transcriptional regulator
MTPQPVEVLKKGLNILQTQAKARKARLESQLAAKKTISSEDERWLDNDANFVDECQILDVLERASDYEKGLEMLDDAQKSVVKRLQEVAGHISKTVGKKRKRTCLTVASITNCKNEGKRTRVQA